eukprot:2977424-Pleurochrysis_carterae.AAC.2
MSEAERGVVDKLSVNAFEQLKDGSGVSVAWVKGVANTAPPQARNCARATLVPNVPSISIVSCSSGKYSLTESTSSVVPRKTRMPVAVGLATGVWPMMASPPATKDLQA